jgi:hypothetical protein
MKTQKIENNLLATHISNNKDFEPACLTGNAEKILYIVDYEIEHNNLHTKGSEKLKNDILKLTKGQAKISASVGQNILFFVWNSRLSGTGLAVC